jgi:hypothetical protein
MDNKQAIETELKRLTGAFLAIELACKQLDELRPMPPAVFHLMGVLQDDVPVYLEMVDKARLL